MDIDKCKKLMYGLFFQILKNEWEMKRSIFSNQKISIELSGHALPSERWMGVKRDKANVLLHNSEEKIDEHSLLRGYGALAVCQSAYSVNCTQCAHNIATLLLTLANINTIAFHFRLCIYCCRHCPLHWLCKSHTSTI